MQQLNPLVYLEQQRLTGHWANLSPEAQWIIWALKYWEEVKEGVYFEPHHKFLAPHPDHMFNRMWDGKWWEDALLGLWLSQEDILWSVRWLFEDFSQYEVEIGEEQVWDPTKCRVCWDNLNRGEWGDLCVECAYIARRPHYPHVWRYPWRPAPYPY